MSKRLLLASCIVLAGCAADPVAPAPVAPPAVIAEAPLAVAPPAAAPSPAPSSTREPQLGDPEARSAAPYAPPSPAPATPAARQPVEGTLDHYLSALRGVSCPPGEGASEPMQVAINAGPVPLQTINPLKRSVDRLTYLGGWSITSGERLGGLSDLKVLPDGRLVSVSDEGQFVWITLDRDGLKPVSAAKAVMLAAGGDPLEDKREADAEGVGYAQGLTFVSFERDHRVLAYDVENCGARARGAPVTFGAYGGAFSDAFTREGLTIGANEGPEPLAVTSDLQMLVGLETLVGGASPLSARPIEARPDFSLRVGPGLPPFVGMDVLEERPGGDLRVFTLHRSFSPTAGNAIVIAETKLERGFNQANAPRNSRPDLEERARVAWRVGEMRQLASMNVLLTIDNFEGIAARRMPDGKVRLYIISDDNFSARQRTLLMVFETAS